MNLYTIGGLKGYNMETLPPEAWRNITGGEQPSTASVGKAYQSVPWLYRATVLRSDAVASVPFSIFRGDTEIDTSDEYQNVVGFAPNLRELIALLEMSLTLVGRGYLFIERNRMRLLRLRYLNPNTIRPIITRAGLVSFERSIGGEVMALRPDETVYFWKPDAFVELGEPKTSPALAAVNAAGVLMSIDEFAKTFVERGMIRPYLVSVPPEASQAEMEKVKSRMGAFMSGIRNAFRMEIIRAGGIEVETLGSGLDELKNNTLTAEKREDIATALGVPHSLLFSNAANYATAQQDDFHFYDKTVRPEIDFIESVMNEQLFGALGYRLRFAIDSLDVFQEDEARRAGAFQVYTNAGLPAPMVAEMLGIELPQGYEYADIQTAQPETEQQPEQDETEPDMKAVDLDKWRRKAVKRVRSGKTAACDFDSDYIPAAMAAAIKGHLDAAETVEDVDSVFEFGAVYP